MKKFIWFIFIALSAYMGYQGYVLQCLKKTGYSIFQLEIACKDSGQAILHTWNNIPYGNGTLLDVAKSNTHWDFLFIACYVLLIILHSSAQMQNEKSLFLNSLLRFNLFLAVLAGFLDVNENIMLLHNFRHVADGYYWVTIWVTIPKFVLSGWAVLIWLISVIKSAVSSS